MKKNEIKIFLKKNFNYIVILTLNNLIFNDRNIIIFGMIMIIHFLILDQVFSIVAFNYDFF
mgnify:FL=1